MSKRTQYVFILLALVIIVIAYGIYIWDKNQRQNRALSQKRNCIELAENKKAEIGKNNSTEGGGVLLRSGEYKYQQYTGDCVFEETTISISKEGSFSMYALYNLFGGQQIAHSIIPLGDDEQDEARSSCEIYNQQRKKYLGEELNCLQ